MPEQQVPSSEEHRQEGFYKIRDIQRRNAEIVLSRMNALRTRRAKQ